MPAAWMGLRLNIYSMCVKMMADGARDRFPSRSLVAIHKIYDGRGDPQFDQIRVWRSFGLPSTGRWTKSSREVRMGRVTLGSSFARGALIRIEGPKDWESGDPISYGPWRQRSTASNAAFGAEWFESVGAVLERRTKGQEPWTCRGVLTIAENIYLRNPGQRCNQCEGRVWRCSFN